ncbi:MAG: hypothetical protein EOM52_08090 [Clostridia bacterium]|nr:hypothetical protein [Clostridia bacterium]
MTAFWKEHATLRLVVMAVTFVAGVALLIGGWMMTGKLSGLGIMLLGVLSLLTTLFVYNEAYK